MSWPLVKYVLTAALRDRLVLSLAVVIALGASLSLFLGSAAVTEKAQFSGVFAAGGLRFAGVAGLVLFVVFHMRRSFDSRDVEFLLSRPVGRVRFLLSHAAAFSLLALVMAIAVTGAACAVSLRGVGAGHVLWGVSIAVEFVVMVNVALFFSMVLSSAASASLAVFGFYVLSRLIGQLLGIVHAGAETHVFKLLGYVMELVSVVIPRLDLMGQTTWLVYGPGDAVGLGFVLAQGVVFTALVLLAALVDLVRRQF